MSSELGRTREHEQSLETVAINLNGIEVKVEKEIFNGGYVLKLKGDELLQIAKENLKAAEIPRENYKQMIQSGANVMRSSVDGTIDEDLRKELFRLAGIALSKGAKSKEHTAKYQIENLEKEGLKIIVAGDYILTEDDEVLSYLVQGVNGRLLREEELKALVANIEGELNPDEIISQSEALQRQVRARTKETALNWRPN
jgi:hypothetical protein